MEKCAYHIPHVKMLSEKECGQMRREALMKMPFSFATGHDYTERLTPNFDFEIQGDHFNKDRSLSMEGYGLTAFDPSKLLDYANGTITLKEVCSSLGKQYHSFFSDDLKQDAVTTHSNMEKLFKAAIGDTKKGLTCLDNTDGCTKQYRRTTALFMLTMLATSLGIIIDRAIGAPGHGKSEIDRLMAIDKVFFRALFQIIVIPEAQEGANQFEAASIKEGKETSLASKCALACSASDQTNGVKSNNKYSKQEKSRIIKSWTYHESRRSNVQCQNFKAAVTDGFEQGPRNGLSAMYNF